MWTTEELADLFTSITRVWSASSGSLASAVVRPAQPIKPVISGNNIEARIIWRSP